MDFCRLSTTHTQRNMCETSLCIEYKQWVGSAAEAYKSDVAVDTATHSKGITHKRAVFSPSCTSGGSGNKRLLERMRHIW